MTRTTQKQKEQPIKMQRPRMVLGACCYGLAVRLAQWPFRKDGWGKDRRRTLLIALRPLALALSLLAATLAPRYGHAEFFQIKPETRATLWDDVARCNQGGSSDDDFASLLWDKFTFHNLHILALTDTCVKRLVDRHGDQAIRTAFMYGKPELLSGAVDGAQLREWMQVFANNGDRLPFRNSAALLPVLREMENKGILEREETLALWGFSTAARAAFGNFDPKTEEIPPNLLDFLPVTGETRAMFDRLCADREACSEAELEKLEQSFCTFEAPIAQKRLLQLDEDRFTRLFNGCDLPNWSVVPFFRIYGLYDGMCSLPIQSNAAMNMQISRARSCEIILSDPVLRDSS